MLANDQEKILPLLNLFDSVQEILQNTNDIDLPKIVVIGDQSSGKSSVLESIAQINLPRGENTVTRSPISIQMRYNQNKYAEINYTFDEEILQNNSQKIKQNFANFDDIDQELRKATENILKIENKESQVTQTQINLKLQSPDMPNLTLIDLPGLTYKNAQFSEAVKQIYRKYIQNPSTIILVVMPADQDFTNTEANIIAAEKDPEKQRTLGIITKIDRHMSRFGQKLQKNDLKYDKLGIFLVRNRTQEELEQKIEYSEVRKREELILQEQEFNFHPNPQKGTKALINILIKLQNDQVMKEKLRVRDDIVQKLKELKEQFQELPEPCTKIKQKSSIFYKMLRKFQQDLDKLYSGMYDEFNEKVIIFQILLFYKVDHLRARIDEMFEDHFTKCSELQNNYLNSDSRSLIQDIVQERKGIELCNFLSFQCFTDNFKNQIQKFQKPSENLIRQVFGYLKQVYYRIIEKNFSRFHDLEEMLKRELVFYLQNLEGKIIDNLKLQCEKESVVIYTKNPLYYDVLAKIRSCINNEQESKNWYDLQQKCFKIHDLKIFQNQCCPELFKRNTENSTLAYQTTEIQISLFSYSNALFKRLMDSIYQEILYQTYLLSNGVSDFFEDKFSPVNGSLAHESCLWISYSSQIESKRLSLEKSQKILMAALAKFEDFEKN